MHAGSGLPPPLVDTAFLYDNALVVIALLASGQEQQARQVAEAIVRAQSHDRFFEDGRLRNAYVAGSALPGDSRPRFHGWADAAGRWLEDRYQVSSDTGNMAWALLALLSVYETLEEERFLNAARRLAVWIETNTRDRRGAGGYTAGFHGHEPAPERLTHKSTEHNLDLAVAFERLAAASKENQWLQSARHARDFVLSMWDAHEGKFWVGTRRDGISINREVVALDAQAWAITALGLSGDYLRALNYVERHMRRGEGYAFSNVGDGIWLEGTAQMAVAYAAVGHEARWRRLMDYLAGERDPATGMLPSTATEDATTGFYLSDGTPWRYFRYLHLGATAWFALAQRQVNPFRPLERPEPASG